jgi:hypothetical protein
MADVKVTSIFLKKNAQEVHVQMAEVVKVTSFSVTHPQQQCQHLWQAEV